MKTNHLSAWEHEECLIGQPAPEVLHHLTECASCRAAVERLEDGVALYRRAAVDWTSECLATRPRQPLIVVSRSLPAAALRWAIAAAVLLVFALLPFHFLSPRPVPHSAEISDDALLQQVDDQVSVSVPASMESLTHLVSADSSGGAGGATAVPGGKHIVQTN
jgi:hypothetical protein